MWRGVYDLTHTWGERKVRLMVSLFAYCSHVVYSRESRGAPGGWAAEHSRAARCACRRCRDASSASKPVARAQASGDRLRVCAYKKRNGTRLDRFDIERGCNFVASCCASPS